MTDAESRPLAESLAESLEESRSLTSRGIEEIVAGCLADFNRGFSCAEAVLLAGCRAAGIDVDSNDALPRVATAFGGGLSRTKGLCGALAGGVMALSVKGGRKVPSDDRAALTAKVQALVAEFTAELGSDNCFTLTGLDFNTPEGQGEYKAKVHSGVCCRAVEFTLRKVIGLLEGA